MKLKQMLTATALGLGIFLINADTGVQASVEDTGTEDPNIPSGVSFDIEPEEAPEYLREMESIYSLVYRFGEEVYLRDEEEPVFLFRRGDDESGYPGTLLLSYDNRTLIVSFGIDITAPGHYYLTIPEGVVGDREWHDSGFSLGRANASILTVLVIPQTYGEYTPDIVPSEVIPEEGTVTGLETVELVFSQGVTYNYENPADVVLRDESGNEVSGAFYSVYTDGEDGKDHAVVKLKTPPITGGRYTLEVPEATFGTSMWLASGFLADHVNAPLSYTWILEPDTSVGQTDALEASPVYFTLEGIEIPKPEPGQLVIERRGGKTKKIIL